MLKVAGPPQGVSGIPPQPPPPAQTPGCEGGSHCACLPQSLGDHGEHFVQEKEWGAGGVRMWDGWVGVGLTRLPGRLSALSNPGLA